MERPPWTRSRIASYLSTGGTEGVVCYACASLWSTAVGPRRRKRDPTHSRNEYVPPGTRAHHGQRCDRLPRWRLGDTQLGGKDLTRHQSAAARSFPPSCVEKIS